MYKPSRRRCVCVTIVQTEGNVKRYLVTFAHILGMPSLLCILTWPRTHRKGSSRLVNTANVYEI